MAQTPPNSAGVTVSTVRPRLVHASSDYRMTTASHRERRPDRRRARDLHGIATDANAVLLFIVLGYTTYTLVPFEQRLASVMQRDPSGQQRVVAA